MKVSGFIAKQFHYVACLLMPAWPERSTARLALYVPTDHVEAYHVARNDTAAHWHAETTERYTRMVGGL